MAPLITSSNTQQPKVWMDGHYVSANKASDGKWYVEVDGVKKEVDGVKKEVDKNDLFGMNNWDKLNESFEEQLASHDKWKQHWLTLQGNASKAYENAIAAFKKSSKKYEEITQGCKINELEGTKKKEAQEYYANMTSASASKRRAVSNTIFYGYMAAAEASYKLGISNLQGIAKIMAHR